jgi:hypothetical protein
VYTLSWGFETFIVMKFEPEGAAAAGEVENFQIAETGVNESKRGLASICK